jgi:hypothetical protein
MCGSVFEAEAYKLRCDDCYRHHMARDNAHQRHLEIAGGELSEQVCPGCHESFQPRYKLDPGCGYCILEGKKLMASKAVEKKPAFRELSTTREGD